MEKQIVSQKNEGNNSSEIRDGGTTISKWGDVLKMLDTSLLDVGKEWWDLSNSIKKDRDSFDETDVGRAMIAAETANRSKTDTPVWQMSQKAREKTLARWEKTQKGSKDPIPQKRVSSFRAKTNRKFQWSSATWNKEFNEWMENFQPVVLKSMYVHPRRDEIYKMMKDGVTPQKTVNGKNVYANVRYAAKGCCNRCRRVTFGFTKTKSIKSQFVDKYGFYFCGCAPKVIGHCIRCVLVDYFDRARKQHGEFRVRDEEGHVIGLKEINCYKNCGVKWGIASIFLLGGPKDEKLKVEEEEKKGSLVLIHDNK